jgi:hypothetical protein
MNICHYARLKHWPILYDCRQTTNDNYYRWLAAKVLLYPTGRRMAAFRFHEKRKKQHDKWFLLLGDNMYCYLVEREHRVKAMTRHSTASLLSRLTTNE